MSYYPNRKTVEVIHCPAIDKMIEYVFISHHDTNRYKNCDISEYCDEVEKCPLKSCRCYYSNGKLNLKD